MAYLLPAVLFIAVLGLLVFTIYQSRKIGELWNQKTSLEDRLKILEQQFADYQKAQGKADEIDQRPPAHSIGDAVDSM
jgi:hypothetical protein